MQVQSLSQGQKPRLKEPTPTLLLLTSAFALSWGSAFPVPPSSSSPPPTPLKHLNLPSSLIQYLYNLDTARLLWSVVSEDWKSSELGPQQLSLGCWSPSFPLNFRGSPGALQDEDAPLCSEPLIPWDTQRPAHLLSGRGKTSAQTPANSYFKPWDSVLIFYCDQLAEARNQQAFKGQPSPLGWAHATDKWLWRGQLPFPL